MSEDLKKHFVSLYLAARRAPLSADEHDSIKASAVAVEQALFPPPKAEAAGPALVKDEAPPA